MNPPPWSLDPWTFAAILGMAIATYACRAGGYWVFSKIKPTPFLRAVLTYIPGTLFVSFVLPALVRGGGQTTIGALATLAVMLRTRSFPWSMLAGTTAAWAVWAFR
jgi:uncharacterized membrane protein